MTSIVNYLGDLRTSANHLASKNNIITDAPIDSRKLKRLVKRGMMGLAKTGVIASNGSGDYVIALSVAKQNLINSKSESSLYKPNYLFNRDVLLFFWLQLKLLRKQL